MLHAGVKQLKNNKPFETDQLESLFCQQEILQQLKR